MSSRYWGALFAAIGLAFVAFCTGAYITALNYPEQERYQSYRYAPGDPEAANAALADKAKPVEYREPCTQPKGREESDLCAQWKAARAAESSALWTERGFWVGLVSIMGLGATIILTLRATEAAQRSALAAEKAIEGADRPHMLLTQSSINLKEPNLEGYGYEFNWGNFGKGPAWLKEWGVLVRILDKEDDHGLPAVIELRPVNWNVAPERGWGSTAPNDVPLPAGRVAEVLADEADMLVFWQINYVDSDGRAHVHRLVQRYEPSVERLIPLDHPFWCYT
ncbi:MAG: hypothetical protein JWM94_1200 [Sphingomonas bacterium]|nr:hypothetical protein [Sphingomonas bacterium]